MQCSFTAPLSQKFRVLEIKTNVTEIVKCSRTELNIESPAHFITDIVNFWYQGQTLGAEEKELATTWVPSNYPSIILATINFSVTGKPFKKYMFVDALEKVIPMKLLKHLDLETTEVIISLLIAVASSASIERIFCVITSVNRHGCLNKYKNTYAIL